jgi:hypothetical protein
MTIFVNLAFTPFMTTGAPFSQTAASSLYLWRQSASAIAAALLLLGSIGLYLRQSSRAGSVGTTAFVCAFYGTALLLAWEWVDVFVLRALALSDPGALQAMEDRPGLNLFDLGALVPVTIFALGWIAFALVTLRSGFFPRLAPCLVIAGFVLTPLLTPALGLWGAGLGTSVLGAGWVWLGVACFGRDERPGPTPATSAGGGG